MLNMKKSEKTSLESSGNRTADICFRSGQLNATGLAEAFGGKSVFSQSLKTKKPKKEKKELVYKYGFTDPRDLIGL